MSRWIASAVSAFVLGIALAAGLAVMTIASPDAQSTGTWQVVGSLVEVRSGATATPLGDGRVLVAGGQNASGLLATAEIVDATGSSSATGSLSVARSGHTATALADGRVLVTGGIAAGAPTPEGAPGPLTTTASAEIFDPSTNAWTPHLMNLARAHHTATRTTGGLVVIAGSDGDGVASRLVEIFNPADNTFSLAGGALSALRTRHAAAALPDNRVLVAGGTNGTDVLASTDIVNATTGTVVAGPSLQSARMNFTATDLLNGDVLVAGGTDGTNELATAERYFKSLGAFGPAPGLSGPRQGHAAVRLPNNAGVIFVGGTASGVSLKQTELFLPASGIFQPQGDQAIEHWDGLAAATGVEGVAIGAGSAGTAAVEGYRFATVKTDKEDYPPGSVVTISGAGWVAGESINLTLHELKQVHPDVALTAVALDDGTFVNSEFTTELQHLGVTFTLSARGSVSEAMNLFIEEHVQFADGTKSPLASFKFK